MPGWDEILHGTSGDDVIIGGSGDDYLQGRAGGDVLDGGAGNDTLHGDDGDDQLKGGEGDDFINGGLGFDTAYYVGSVSEYTFTVGQRQCLHLAHRAAPASTATTGSSMSSGWSSPTRSST